MKKSTKGTSVLKLKETSKIIKKKSSKPLKPNAKVNKKHVEPLKKINGNVRVNSEKIDDKINSLGLSKIKTLKDNVLTKKKKVLKEQSLEIASVNTKAIKVKSNVKKQSKVKTVTSDKTEINAALNKKEPLLNIQENEEEKEADCKTIPFNENVFHSIVSQKKVKSVVSLLKSKVEEEVSKTKKIFTDFRYVLNVACFKIPNCPKRVVKLNLKHGLFSTTENDIVLITKDLQRGAKVDYDPTIQFYEDLLRENNLENVKILPFNQLRKEFNTFELKRKLSNLYDYYMCDGSIVSHVNGFVGTTFQKTRCTLHSVRTNDHSKIAQEIGKTLKRTSFLQLRKGNLISIPIGTHKHSEVEIAENIMEVVGQLKTIFPGGYENIRNMHIKIDMVGTSSLPIYISLAKPIENTPNVIGLREQKLVKLKRRANEILSNFKLTQNAKLEKLSLDHIKRKQKVIEENTIPSKQAKKKTTGIKVSKKAKGEVKNSNEQTEEEQSEQDDNSD